MLAVLRAYEHSWTKASPTLTAHSASPLLPASGAAVTPRTASRGRDCVVTAPLFNASSSCLAASAASAVARSQGFTSGCHCCIC